MATVAGNRMRYSTSPELSDPPSMLSAPASPSGLGRAKQNGEYDEIVVDPTSIRYDGSGQPLLTKDGLPRRKPGPKPGSRIKRSGGSLEDVAEKPKRMRKPKDTNAAPASRRRKGPATDADNGDAPSRTASSPTGTGTAGSGSRQPKANDSSNNTAGRPATVPQKPKAKPGSMSSILNAEPEPPQSYHHQQQSHQPQSQPKPPPRPSVTRTSGTAYDPIRSSNYDPVRETMLPHNYSSAMGSPRGPTTTNAINRASASPSIASLVDPPVQKTFSPAPSQTSFALNPPANRAQAPAQVRPQRDSSSVPASPNLFRKDFVAPPIPKPPTAEAKKPMAPMSTLAASKIEIRPTSITTIGAAGAKRATSKNISAASSSPRVRPTNSADPPPSRSILDFGRAEPGAELVVPSIVLNIPLNGETNKYVNFMRLAEERYGWDALHPRQAEHKARKARIAAASAALAQNDSSREGDEMSVDESDNDDSNIEMGGISGPDKNGDGKPAKKKRHFKEDEYDRDDDFVDDSEMMWEEQAAASRDGFFVYSGPLVREVEKPEPGRGEGAPKRGRGSRGGRGAKANTNAGAARARGGGARGGSTRKPRMTKADKAQLDREKAEREANANSMLASDTSYSILQPNSPKFAGL
ncbi:HPC2-domain-containing protein [Xylaria sp. CBS 124048]|nr:HPC2-domain-containing protein [Xylaria sp. CBS 124048]